MDDGTDDGIEKPLWHEFNLFNLFLVIKKPNAHVESHQMHCKTFTSMF